jgi:hypothetical protein
MSRSLRSMLPERYQSPAYWDDEAAMQAFLDDVHALAALALNAARAFDEENTRGASEAANELHAAAEVVCPGIAEAA